MVKWMIEDYKFIVPLKLSDSCESAETVPQGQKQCALDHFIFIIIFFNEAKASLL